MTQKDLTNLALQYGKAQAANGGFITLSVIDYQVGFNKALELVLEKCHVRDGATLLTMHDMEDILDSL